MKIRNYFIELFSGDVFSGSYILNVILFQLEMTLVTALRCRDELFLSSIFDWLIEKNLTERLLEVIELFQWRSCLYHL